MAESYEYLPPHGKPAPRRMPSPMPTSKDQYEVVIPWSSETIRRTVLATDEKNALNKVAMGLAKSLNLPPNKVFQRLHSEKKFTVKKIEPQRQMSSFTNRAQSIANTNLDLVRMERLPYVEEAILYTKSGNTVTYRAIMKPANTLAQSRELTGYLQTLFGSRLLSSGPTEITTPDKTKRSVVEVRVSLLQVV